MSGLHLLANPYDLPLPDCHALAAHGYARVYRQHTGRSIALAELARLCGCSEAVLRARLARWRRAWMCVDVGVDVEAAL